MIVENTEAFRSWLTSCLEPLCDADPIALAKYVMALIKKDKPEKDLKSICLDQLEVFLSAQTITFVDTLFQTIANKSYLNAGSAPASSTTTASAIASTTTTTASKTSTQTVTLDSQPSATQKSSDIIINSNSNSRSEQQSSSLTATKAESSTHESSSKPRDNTRRRSRSRSRSPARGTRRNEFDTRRLGPVSNRNNGSTYFNDDRRNRRGNVNNRRAGNQRFGGYRNDRDYRRGPKRGRSHSRSPRSFSSGSPSPTRDRSRSRSRDRDSPSNKRSRPASRPTSRSPTPPKPALKDAEKSKKCRDYEEKGFCLKGHLCPYDHGNDPVVLDSNVSAALGFTNTNPTGAPMHPMPPVPNIPPNAPNAYLAEPYNPEAPGMDPNIQRPLPPPPGGLPPLGPRMLPPHYWGGPMPGMRGPMPGGPPMPPPPFMPPPGRPRELRGVPTIDNRDHHNQHHSNRTVIEPNNQMQMRGGMRGRGHMGRGGYRNVRRVHNDNQEKTCLEVRKIPPNLNSISHLNEHFGKFGHIVNLQVCHEGDAEAALVQYASHSEALSAIRNTEAVLNNRFIKVFWRSKEQQQDYDQIFGPKNESTDDSEATPKTSIKDRLGPKVSESSEIVTTGMNPLGNISRTVFDPSKLKKNNTKPTDSLKESGNINDNTNQLVHRTTKSPTKENNKNQISVKQHNLLKELIKEQNQLVKKLENSTNEKDKKFFKETIDNISSKINVVSESIKKGISDKKNDKKVQTKEEFMEELLNTELELHVKVQNNDMSYLEVADKLAKLKKKHKMMKSGGYSPRGRGAKTYPRRGRGVYHRGGFGAQRGLNPLLKVDRRTRKLLIPDIAEDDTTDLLEHLAQFSDVEVIEPSNSGAVVTFKTRMDAERAIQNMSQIKFKENFQLNYSWFDDKIGSKSDINVLTKTKTISESKSENEALGEMLGEELLDFEEDDTEDDESEARNWKA